MRKNAVSAIWERDFVSIVFSAVIDTVKLRPSEAFVRISVYPVLKSKISFFSFVCGEGIKPNIS